MDFEAFRICFCLRGLTNLLMDFALNPDFATRLLDMIAAKRCESIRIAFELGADILMTADDYAFQTGPMMGPPHFDRFILPYIRQKAELVHGLGGYHIKHCDGNLWSTLDKLVKAGVDGIDPLEPIARMDIGDVKAKYGDRLALQGNIDVSMLLPFGAPEEVEEAVKETIAKAAPGGGYIMRDSNSIHESVNPINYRTMFEACRRWGEYPLDPAMVKEYRTKNYIKKYIT
jgi:uroporphyrinogen decarboxylase